MGTSESKNSSQNESLLTEGEKQQAQVLFNAISHGKKFFTKELFQVIKHNVKAVTL